MNWLRSWTATVRIMIFERELYRELTKPFDMDDFREVMSPGEFADSQGEDSARWTPGLGWVDP